MNRRSDQGLRKHYVSEANNSGKKSAKKNTVGPEDRRIRRTKKMLKEALIDLIIEKGYDEFSVQDVIERADVGRTSFYAYFRSKEDLLLRSLDDLKEMFDPEGDESGEPRWGFILVFFQHLDENRAIARGLLGKRSAPVVKQHLQEQLLQHFKNILQKQRAIADPLQIECAAVFASGALISLILWWFDVKRRVTPETMDANFRRLLLPGMESFFKK